MRLFTKSSILALAITAMCTPAYAHASQTLQQTISAQQQQIAALEQQLQSDTQSLLTAADAQVQSELSTEMSALTTKLQTALQTLQNAQSTLASTTGTATMPNLPMTPGQLQGQVASTTQAINQSAQDQTASNVSNITSQMQNNSMTNTLLASSNDLTLPPNECSLAIGYASPCPTPLLDSSVTSPPNYVAAASEPGLTRGPIDVWGYCRYVDNITGNTPVPRSVFVPFRSGPEWLAFINNAPADTFAMAHCARPAVMVVPPNTNSSMGNSSMGNSSMGNSSMGNSSMGNSSMGNSSMGNSSMGKQLDVNSSMDNSSMGNNSMGNNSMDNSSMGNNSMGDPYPCGNPTPPNQPVFLPYGRQNETQTRTVTFVCTTDTGISWIKQATATFVGLDSDNSGASPNWSMTDVTYSGNPP